MLSLFIQFSLCLFPVLAISVAFIGTGFWLRRKQYGPQYDVGGYGRNRYWVANRDMRGSDGATFRRIHGATVSPSRLGWLAMALRRQATACRLSRPI